jgi:hypothetical protein
MQNVLELLIEYLPLSQTEHEDDPATKLYLPGSQSLQNVEPI